MYVTNKSLLQRCAKTSNASNRPLNRIAHFVIVVASRLVRCSGSFGAQLPDLLCHATSLALASRCDRIAVRLSSSGYCCGLVESQYFDKLGNLGMIACCLHAMTPRYSLLFMTMSAVAWSSLFCFFKCANGLWLLISRCRYRCEDILWFEKEFAAHLALVAHLEDVSLGDLLYTLDYTTHDTMGHAPAHIGRLGAHL